MTNKYTHKKKPNLFTIEMPPRFHLTSDRTAFFKQIKQKPKETNAVKGIEEGNLFTAS